MTKRLLAVALAEYCLFFAAEAHVGILFCNSAVQFEAASRACGTPMNRVVATWQASLAAS